MLVFLVETGYEAICDVLLTWMSKSSKRLKELVVNMLKDVKLFNEG